MAQLVEINQIGKREDLRVAGHDGGHDAGAEQAGEPGGRVAIQQDEQHIVGRRLGAEAGAAGGGDAGLGELGARFDFGFDARVRGRADLSGLPRS